ncbi:MAG: hypothetical protein ISS87_00695 [Candidatus Pacebacteria bacterium]|nr:hypothetical protein [Candidatus Paceibacterota bacterium]
MPKSKQYKKIDKNFQIGRIRTMEKDISMAGISESNKQTRKITELQIEKPLTKPIKGKSKIRDPLEISIQKTFGTRESEIREQEKEDIERLKGIRELIEQKNKEKETLKQSAKADFDIPKFVETPNIKDTNPEIKLDIKANKPIEKPSGISIEMPLAIKKDEIKNNKNIEIKKQDNEKKIKIDNIANEKEILQQEKTKTQKEIEKLNLNKKPLEKNRIKFLSKKQELEEFLSPIVKREQEIEQRIKIIERKEKEIKTSQEKREIESSRWTLEEKRRKLEKRKWEQEKEIIIINQKINNIEEEIKRIEQKESKAKEKIKDSIKRIQEIDLEKKKEELYKKLEEIPEIELPFKNQKLKIVSLKTKLSQEIQEISEQEQKAQELKQGLEKEEEMAETSNKRREIENKRWVLEEEIKRIEQKRWAQQEKIDSLDFQIKTIDDKLNKFETEKEEARNNIKQTNFELLKLTTDYSELEEKESPIKPLNQEPLAQKNENLPNIEKEIEKPVVEIKKEIKKEIKQDNLSPIKISENEDFKKRLEQARKRIQALKAISDENTLNKPYILPETKADDQIQDKINKPDLYKVSAGKPVFTKTIINGQNKIKQSLQKIKKSISPASVSPAQINSVKTVEIFRPVIKKPSKKERYLIRILLVLVIILSFSGLFTFWYWYLTQK